MLNCLSANCRVELFLSANCRVELFLSANCRVELFLSQPVEPVCAEALCRMFPLDEHIDLKAIAIKARRARRLLERERCYNDRAPPSSTGPPPPAPVSRQDIPRSGLLLSGLSGLSHEMWAKHVSDAARKRGFVCHLMDVAVLSKMFTFHSSSHQSLNNNLRRMFPVSMCV